MGLRSPQRATTAAALLALLAGAAAAQEPVDFTRDIRPLLSDRCFVCHGPDAAAREADLRLDLREAAIADLGGEFVIAPGKPEESLLLQRVRHASARKRMPPKDSGLSLDEGEIALLERWIAEGADYAEHWSFVLPADPEPPSVQNEAWPSSELDRFVLARLEAEGLSPAPATDRATWLRRVTFDLTGLPPTLEELDAFLGDETSGAFERVVDRLLASQDYGERMASMWLDAARYADTYGYQSDVERRVWPWRDWVVEAFNADLPYDEFATWQLAGDLLPDATREQRLATTFNRLHRQTNEGGSVEEEFRVEYVADRVHTFGTAFLGLTFECARCHDHKYDPISQREYYQLFAFFDDIDESGLYSHFTRAVPTPTLWLPDGNQEAQLEQLDAARSAAAAAYEAGLTELDAKLAAWRAARPDSLPIAGRVNAYDFDEVRGTQVPALVPGTVPGQLGPTVVAAEGAVTFDGDAAALFEEVGTFTRDDPFSIAVRLRATQASERAVLVHRSRAWTDAGSRGYELLLEDGRLSAALVHFWPGNALRVHAIEPLPLDRWLHVTMTYDGSSTAAGLRLFLDGVPLATEVVRDGLTRTIQGGGETALALGERFRDRGFAGGSIDALEVYDRELARVEVAAIAAAERTSLAEDAAVDASDLASDPDDERELFVLAHSEELRTLRQALRDARRARSALVDRIPEIMTMAELSEPRTAYLLERGSYLARGEQVEPSTPVSVLAFDADLRPDRLGLAQWLVGERNPLFARVAANRLWQVAFGSGLVATPENFGSQGAVPEHPELLDHLAQELRALGWSQKALLRQLVLSSTYRQSSRADARTLERDPENRLHARGPKKALTAEMVRDNALALSGLLVEWAGGRSSFPYQPPGLWREVSGGGYSADSGKGLWRRSLYTFWKRTSPPPSMMLFDAAKRDVCVVRRQETETPLQALALWNDPQQLEAARALAQRVLLEAEGGASDDARLLDLFRRCTTRPPDAEELAALAELLRDARADFAADEGSAERYLAVGAAQPKDDLDPNELAAHAVVASALLAYDGTLMLR